MAWVTAILRLLFGVIIAMASASFWLWWNSVGWHHFPTVSVAFFAANLSLDFYVTQYKAEKRAISRG